MGERPGLGGCAALGGEVVGFELEVDCEGDVVRVGVGPGFELGEAFGEGLLGVLASCLLMAMWVEGFTLQTLPWSASVTWKTLIPGSSIAGSTV